MTHPHLAAIQSLPYHQYLGVVLLHSKGGKSQLAITVDEHSANVRGLLHGGVVHSLLDLAAYAALVSQLAPQEAAVTHDLHVSIMRPANLGSRVLFEGEVVRKGRTLAFVDARAWVDDKLMATARVTKTLVNEAPPAG